MPLDAKKLARIKAMGGRVTTVGLTSRKYVTFSTTPNESGRIPVIRLAREGLQIASWQ